MREEAERLEKAKQKMIGLNLRENEMQLIHNLFESIGLSGQSVDSTDYVEPPETLGKSISKIMEGRHDQEMERLLSSQFQERTDLLKSQLDLLSERKQTEQVRILKELKERVRPAGNTEIERELKDLDTCFVALQTETMETGALALIAPHAEAQLALKGKLIGEVRTTLLELLPSDACESNTPSFALFGCFGIRLTILTFHNMQPRPFSSAKMHEPRPRLQSLNKCCEESEPSR